MGDVSKVFFPRVVTSDPKKFGQGRDWKNAGCREAYFFPPSGICVAPKSWSKDPILFG